MYQNDEVQQAVDGGAFELGLAGVLHELGVPAGEEDDPVAPGRVAQNGAAQQHTLVVQRELLVPPCQGSLKFGCSEGGRGDMSHVYKTDAQEGSLYRM